jgi:hypothetical protein
MKFLMTYEQTKKTPPTPEKMAEIGRYSMEMAQKGVLVMTGGLRRPTKGTRVKLSDDQFTVTDGPFAESKELIDGFALIEVKDKEEAIRVAREFMGIAGDGEGEILEVFEQGGPPPQR